MQFFHWESYTLFFAYEERFSTVIVEVLFELITSLRNRWSLLTAEENDMIWNFISFAQVINWGGEKKGWNIKSINSVFLGLLRTQWPVKEHIHRIVNISLSFRESFLPNSTEIIIPEVELFFSIIDRMSPSFSCLSREREIRSSRVITNLPIPFQREGETDSDNHYLIILMGNRISLWLKSENTFNIDMSDKMLFFIHGSLRRKSIDYKRRWASFGRCIRSYFRHIKEIYLRASCHDRLV